MQPVSGLWEGKKLKLKLGCRILPGDQMVKNLPVMQETWVQSMCQEDPLEMGKATHSRILAWRIPWTTVHGVTKSWTELSDFHFPGSKSRSRG